MGAIMYLVGCFQGSTEALRSLQTVTHFTDFVVSHSHLTIFGTFVMWAIGGSVYARSTRSSTRKAFAMSADRPDPDRDVETFAQGEVHSYLGVVNGWLLAVYGILAVWGVYYVVRYWGGPGLAR